MNQHLLTSTEGVTELSDFILMVLADDLGVECLSSYGGISHETPNPNQNKHPETARAARRKLQTVFDTLGNA